MKGKNFSGWLKTKNRSRRVITVIRSFEAESGTITADTYVQRNDTSHYSNRSLINILCFYLPTHPLSFSLTHTHTYTHSILWPFRRPAHISDIHLIILPPTIKTSLTFSLSLSIKHTHTQHTHKIRNTQALLPSYTQSNFHTYFYTVIHSINTHLPAH